MKKLNLSNIKNYLSKIKITNILFFTLIILCGILYTLNYNTSLELENVRLNLKASNDSIVVYKNKNNQNVYKIKSLVASYNQLKDINSNLVYEINKLTKQDKKNLIEINKLNLHINLLNDSIKYINNNLISQSIDSVSKLTTYNYGLKDSTKFRELSAIIKVKSISQPLSVNTEISKDIIYTDLVIGKTLKNNQLELFVTSSNPGLVVTSLEGSIVDLKKYNKLQPKKKFSIGLQFGYGMTKSGFSPYAGIGGSFNLISF